MSIKRAMKGIRSGAEIDHDAFLCTLYTNSVKYSTQNRMNFIKKYGTLGILECRKRALNPIFTKMMVQEDLVTIKPLRKNGEFI